MDEYRQRQSAHAACLLSDLHPLGAYLAYYAIGDHVSELDIDACPHELNQLPTVQRDLVPRRVTLQVRDCWRF